MKIFQIFGELEDLNDQNYRFNLAKPAGDGIIIFMDLMVEIKNL